MKSVPQSFNFDNAALAPDYVIKTSYGNDSVALIQFLHEYDQRHPLGKVVALYNDTGWAAGWWAERVEKAEAMCRSYGFTPARTQSIGMLALIKKHNIWPDRLWRFCTEDLKIIPTHSWLAQNDPSGVSIMCCGVRREESAARSLWPEWVESSPKNEGRSEWSPLVYHTVAQRDELIRRAGWEPLPHRSRECYCVLANASDIASWDESGIAMIENAEVMMNRKNRGENKFHLHCMFRPHKKAGNPVGIRAVVEWAKAAKAKQDARNEKDPPNVEPEGCDSGYCGG